MDFVLFLFVNFLFSLKLSKLGLAKNLSWMGTRLGWGDS